MRQQHAESLGVLEGLRCSLAGAGLERVGGVADEDHAVATPGWKGRRGPGGIDGVDVGVGDDAADDRVCPTGMSCLELTADVVFVEVAGVGEGLDRVG